MWIRARWTRAPTYPMETTSTVLATVTRDDGRTCRPRPLRVTFERGVPVALDYRGATFTATGRRAAHHRTGALVVELATPADARVWVTLDGTRVDEDGCTNP